MAKKTYKAEDVWLITTSRFSREATQTAAANGIVLVDGAALARLRELLRKGMAAPPRS